MTLKTTPKELAEQIAADLFTNGNGDRAERLVILDSRGRDCGGWCERAIVTLIESALRQAMEDTR